MAGKYHRIIINPPGRINLRLRGRFVTVTLDTLSQGDLKELYDNGCQFVGYTDEDIPPNITVDEIKTGTHSMPDKKNGKKTSKKKAH